MTLAAIQNTPILMYHSISDYITPRFRSFTVDIANFTDQMAYLHQNDYTPLTVTQFVTSVLDNNPLPSRPVVLTFDDSFADFYTNALPILQKYQFPATLYIPTAFVGSTSRWLEMIGEGDRPMLGWDKLAEITTLLIECGAHSHTHADLDTIPRAQAREEIFGCKAILEEHLGQEILSFAYPFGHIDATVHQLVREAGFTSACSVHAPSRVDVYTLPRRNMGSNMTLDAFARLLEHRPSIVERRLIPVAADLWRIVRRTKAGLTT